MRAAELLIVSEDQARQVARYETLTDTLRSQITDLQGIQEHLEGDLVQHRAEIARHARQCDEGGNTLHTPSHTS